MFLMKTTIEGNGFQSDKECGKNQQLTSKLMMKYLMFPF